MQASYRSCAYYPCGPKGFGTTHQEILLGYPWVDSLLVESMLQMRSKLKAMKSGTSLWEALARQARRPSVSLGGTGTS